MRVQRLFFIGLFICIQALFLFLFLQKQEFLIALSYDLQRKSQMLDELKRERRDLSLSLEQQKSEQKNKKIAQNVLNMVPMKLSDTRNLK